MLRYSADSMIAEKSDGSQLTDARGPVVGHQNPFRGFRGRLGAAMLTVVEQALGDENGENAEEIR